MYVQKIASIIDGYQEEKTPILTFVLTVYQMPVVLNLLIHQRTKYPPANSRY